ncbi:FKBP-type peptidyl-prolyl cis-trans isomerase [Ferruginibacter sp.]
MIKKLLVFSALAILFVSCTKSNEPTCPFADIAAVAPASEITAVQNYVTSSHPAAIQHSSGLFYEITTAGTGSVNPGVCSNITVKYTGTLTNGFKFDENLTGFSERLGGLILGWQKGLPLIKSGGSISLYIPPSLGYGSNDIKDRNGVVIIPANSILVFAIQLVAVQ